MVIFKMDQEKLAADILRGYLEDWIKMLWKNSLWNEVEEAIAEKGGCCRRVIIVIIRTYICTVRILSVEIVMHLQNSSLYKAFLMMILSVCKVGLYVYFICNSVIYEKAASLISFLFSFMQWCRRVQSSPVVGLLLSMRMLHASMKAWTSLKQRKQNIVFVFVDDRAIGNGNFRIRPLMAREVKDIRSVSSLEKMQNIYGLSVNSAKQIPIFHL